MGGRRDPRHPQPKGSIEEMSSRKVDTTSAQDLVSARFARDSVTWLAYLGLAAYNFSLYALGPALTYLHGELRISYTLTSLHSTLCAVGMVVAGLTFDRVVARFGRQRTFWVSALTMSVGILLFLMGRTVVMTLIGAGVLGTGGAFLQAGTYVILADRHGRWRDRALVEANLGASITAVFVPVLLGLLAATAVGWRPGMLPPVAVLSAFFIVLGRTSMPAPEAVGRHSAGRFPAGFWQRCLLIGLVVGVEFCIVFFGASLLRVDVGLSAAAATSLMSLFYVGELLGRLAGARLTRRPGRAPQLIGVGLTVAMGGFLVLWLARPVPLVAVALLVTGAGVANLGPLGMALSLGSAGGRTDVATARTQMSIGLSIGLSPFVLGVLADRVGVHSAFSVEIALIVIAAFVLLVILTHERDAVVDSPVSLGHNA